MEPDHDFESVMTSPLQQVRQSLPLILTLLILPKELGRRRQTVTGGASSAPAPFAAPFAASESKGCSCADTVTSDPLALTLKLTRPCVVGALLTAIGSSPASPESQLRGAARSRLSACDRGSSNTIAQRRCSATTDCDASV